jgi:uncharacterized membrane protein YagU involved in acid resistance
VTRIAALQRVLSMIVQSIRQPYEREDMIQLEHGREAKPVQAMLQGGLAGFVATGPMSVFMLATKRFLPRRHRYALPPEIITEELAHRMHVRWHMNKMEVEAATIVSHFGYGATMGMLYGTSAKLIPLPSPVKGVLFGLIVWAASYLGLLPLIGMSESGQREPGRRNLMMIAAHIVWGVTLGLVAEVLSEKVNSGHAKRQSD